MSRRRKALYLFLGLAVVLGLLAAHMVAELRRGEDIFWLAELWLPAAVLSVGLVTGIEFLMPAAGHGHAHAAAAAPAAPAAVVTVAPAVAAPEAPAPKAKARRAPKAPQPAGASKPTRPRKTAKK
jgi:hypothetical protein